MRLTQDVLLRLAGGRARDLVEEDDTGRPLVGREAFRAVGKDFVCRRRLRMGDDEGDATLAPFRIGKAKHCDVADLRMRPDDSFDLCGDTFSPPRCTCPSIGPERG